MRKSTATPFVTGNGSSSASQSQSRRDVQGLGISRKSFYGPDGFDGPGATNLDSAIAHPSNIKGLSSCLLGWRYRAFYGVATPIYLINIAAGIFT